MLKKIKDSREFDPQLKSLLETYSAEHGAKPQKMSLFLGKKTALKPHESKQTENDIFLLKMRNGIYPSKGASILLNDEVLALVCYNQQPTCYFQKYGYLNIGHIVHRILGIKRELYPRQ